MSKYKARASLPFNLEGFINARVPCDVVYFFDDFLVPSCSLEPYTDMNTDGTSPIKGWTITDVGTAAAAKVNLGHGIYNYKSTLGGILRVTTTATVDGGQNLQAGVPCFAVDQDNGLPLYFETKFRTQDVSNTDIAVGISAIDAEIITTGADDFIGFLLESGVLYCHAAESSNEKSVDTSITETDGAAASDSGWVRCAFAFDGADTITFMVDDDNDGEFDFETNLNVSTGTDYIPDDVALLPTIEVITGTTATAEVADIDYVFCAQQRYHA